MKMGRVSACLYLVKPGMSVREAELKQFAPDHMAHFKVPAAFTTIEELPKAATGKIQKFLLRGDRRALSAH
jgi:fatty-acyl-CoA synthase